MKKLFLALLVTVAGSTVASAQIYRPSVVGQSTVLGAVAGALIGGHNNDHWAEGAVIGAAAGAVVGSVVDSQRSSLPVVYSQSSIAPVAVVADAPMIGAQSQITYASPAPQVVYVNAAPQRVVYVDPYPVYVSRPAVYIGATWGGYGWGGHRYRGHNSHHHGGDHRGGHGHRGHR